ncbi:N-acetylmuramoyl-L-alanine amidase [Sinomicrobium pectinilyticum]|uniref:N-acetylmuramoyl-L-alanine amidase n=1 Tax=Sinomicrobium pectinilyticum TaxID=1084421 RepID=A0A3N0EQD9_SINP1|nr:N-acetylmuramoyl-L-alanine amidase [Sinomicrobium pectinilyticum]RNL90116.1 N-acetylmuramoyl-L-alanine amidase [Sinomicrobium pectinilyticum]
MLISLKVGKTWRLKNVIFGLLLLKSCVFFGQNLPDKRVIVIDPGHGGIDSGAIGINGIREKDVVLDIAKEIVRLNKTLFNGQLDIYLTRYQDTLISLSNRTKLGKTLKADVLVSLHCNHSGNADARGIEVYANKRKNVFSKHSVWLGYQIQKELKEQLHFESRGVKFASFQVLREATDYYPAVLVEMGFLSNEDESGYLLDNRNIRALALAILIGIVEFLTMEL